jgi:hypothetical protein
MTMISARGLRARLYLLTARFLRLLTAIGFVLALPSAAGADTLLSLPITSAITVTKGQVYGFETEYSPKNMTIQANFIYGSGGTTVDAYLQTSIDQGNTWCDVAQFHFTTSSARKQFNLSSLTPNTSELTCTDGSLSANSAQDGLFGSLIRVKYVTVGTYAGGTSLQVDVISQRLSLFPNN